MPIHPTAVIDPAAEIHPSATIGPHAVIEGPVKIGADTHVCATAVIMGDTTIGVGCRIHSHAVLGDFPQDYAFHGRESSLKIGDACIIREGATVHRGTLEGTTTVIGNRCFLMTNSHVAHNCVVGDEAVLVSGCVLGGYVQVGRKAIISGNAAIHQFTRIGELAIVGGLSKVVKDVPPFFMTDHEGAIAGINAVGLRRAGFTPQDRRDIKEALRIIYRSGLTHAETLETLRAECTSDAAARLIAWLAGESKRGIARAANRARGEEFVE